MASRPLRTLPTRGRVLAIATSGFVPLPKWTAVAVDIERNKVVSMIKDLGAVYIEGDEWEDGIDLVVVFSPARNSLGLSEKVLAALAGGRMVVTTSFVEKSHKVGHWVRPRAHIFPRERCLLKKETLRARSFAGMRIFFALANKRRSEVYKRVVKAGGGNVLDDWDTLDDVAKDPYNNDLTHVILDPWETGDSPIAVATLAVTSPRLYMVHYYFLFEKVLARRGATETKWRIDGKLVKRLLAAESSFRLQPRDERLGTVSKGFEVITIEGSGSEDVEIITIDESDPEDTEDSASEDVEVITIDEPDPEDIFSDSDSDSPVFDEAEMVAIDEPDSEDSSSDRDSRGFDEESVASTSLR